MTSFPVRIIDQGSGSGFTALEGPHTSSRFQTNQEHHLAAPGRARGEPGRSLVLLCCACYKDGNTMGNARKRGRATQPVDMKRA